MGDVGTPVLDATAAEAPSAVHVQFAGVRDEGAERFDAAGWHYLDTLNQQKTNARKS